MKSQKPLRPQGSPRNRDRRVQSRSLANRRRVVKPLLPTQSKLKDEHLLIVGVVVSIVLGLALLLFPLVKKVIVKQVIQDLQSNYTPGPYTPGFDMDKVNYDIWLKPQQAMQQEELPPVESKVTQQYLPRSFRPPSSR